MNIFKRIISIIIFIILFFCIGEFLRYILIDDTKSFTRIMFHEFYTSNKNIDIVFVGSSHCMNSFIPSIVDKKLNSYSFNIASSSQGLDGSFVMIKELCAYNNKPKQIYLELYYGVTGSSEYKDRDQMTNTYILSDYMKPSFRKIMYLLNASSKEHYVNSFILARRNWKKLFDFDYIINLIKRKQDKSYKNYQWNFKRQQSDYIKRGFVACNIKILDDVYWTKPRRDEVLRKSIQLTEKNDWYKNLLDIINFCKKENIKLTFVIAPEPEKTIIAQKKYQEYHNFINNIADKYDLDFWDFNLCKPEYFDTNNLNLFHDEQHLSKIGAEEFSNIFADFVCGNISKKDLFYDTFKEKLNSEKTRVLGFAGPYENSKLKICEGYIVSNRDKEIEYKIEVKLDKGKNRLIQDYSVNNKFTLPVNEHGKVIVSWRLVNNKDKINIIVADY